ncbi:MAG: glycine zipper family protein [Deltaproteobacteria bacterium]|nr:glycine zipper family protein [Deltaproteobacteria bacterium]
MQKILQILSCFLLLQLCSCMQKSSRHLREQTQLTTPKQGVPELRPERVVHPESLIAPDLEVFPQRICTSDEAALLRVKTSDKDVDYFEYSLCPKAGGPCWQASFLDLSPLIAAPGPGDYTVVARACVYPDYDKATAQCGPESEEKDFAAKQVSDQARSLLAKQTRLREKMIGICGNMRRIMKDYLANEDDRGSPLYVQIQNFLEYTGPNVCSETLLSRELMVLDDISQTHPELLTPEPEKEKDKKEATPVIVYTRSPLMGLLFLGIGASGIYLSGLQAYLAMKNTVSEHAKELGKEIFLLDKKREAIEVARLEIENKELDDILKHRTDPDFISGTEANVKARIVWDLDFIIVHWQPVWGWGGDQRMVEQFETLKREIQEGTLNSETAWRRMTEIVQVYNKALPLWSIRESFEDIPSWRGLEWESPYRRLQRSMQHKELIGDLRQKAQKYGQIGTQNFEQTIQAKKKEIAATLRTKRNSWENYLTGLATTAFAKGREKVTAMAVLGAGVGVVLGYFPLLPIPGGRLGAIAGGFAVGGTLGFVAGGYKGVKDFVDAHRELKPTDWTEDDLRRFESGDTETLRGLQVDLEAQTVAKSRAYTMEELKYGNVKAKLAAAFPWLAGVGVSAFVAYLGTRELALASSDAQNTFMGRYTELYQQGRKIQKAYFDVQNNLLLDNCRD